MTTESRTANVRADRRDTSPGHNRFSFHIRNVLRKFDNVNRSRVPVPGAPTSSSSHGALIELRISIRKLKRSTFTDDGNTHTATGSLNLPHCCIWYIRSPPFTYSITKYRRSCSGKQKADLRKPRASVTVNLSLRFTSLAGKRSLYAFRSMLLFAKT